LSFARLPLLARIGATLATVGLLPLLVSFYQLRTNKDALLEQVQRTHIVAASTAATRVEEWLGSLRALATSITVNPALAEPHGSAAQELLRGTLQAHSTLAAIALYNDAGEQIVLAQRIDLKGDVAAVLDAGGEEELSVVVSGEQRWLRLRRSLRGDLGSLLLVTAAAPLAEMVVLAELGDEADLLLATRAGEVLFSSGVSLDEIPPSIVARAANGSLASGAAKHRVSDGEDLIVAHYQVRGAPWYVLSRQPARIAEVAQNRIRQATWVAALGAVMLTILLSSAAQISVVRPLQRLVKAQRELAGLDPGSGSGSEIEQLETAFEALQKRHLDRAEVGKIFLGRYEVIELIASGSMGTVFRGWDPKLRRVVALKTVRVSSDEIDRERLKVHLLREAATYARFNHPNIVTVYDILDAGSAACVAMELVDGVSLQGYLRRGGAMAADQVMILGAAVARALAAAHSDGLVHHDVKPANILLGFDGSIKVTDFGLSKLLSSAAKDRTLLCGTPGYVAPESLDSGHYDSRSDLFALGVVLYECLANKHPFYDGDLQRTLDRTRNADPAFLRGAIAMAPDALVELILLLLSRDPAGRPADATVVAEELDKLAFGLVWRPDADVLAAASGRAPAAHGSQFLPIGRPPGEV